MPQKFGLYEDLTVMENLILCRFTQRYRRDMEKTCPFVELTALGLSLAVWRGNSSGGMKQKLGLACTLVGEPKSAAVG
ncbi:hypothetical protein KCP71_23275 [Salmonella enterica subsp. enterica]|nr:hypothetical protein KCP71_23275 [Salmonella enterica subsp. enterica]